MAKIRRGILGGFSGKVGTVIGSKWRGINTMRAVPEQVRDAKTVRQMRQRQRFSLITRLLKETRSFVNAGFEVTGKASISGHNAALSYNIRFAVSGEYPDQELDYSQIRFAMGTLEGPQNAQVTVDGDGNLAFTWSDNSGIANAQATDTVMLLAYHPGLGSAVMQLNGAERKDESEILSLPSAYAGVPLHVYLAFSRVSGPERSNSVYLGTVQVPE